MGHTLGTAAKAARVSKTTMRRAIQSGRVSATRLDDGSYEIDPAELHRAFPGSGDASAPMARSVTTNGTGELRVENEMLRDRLAEKDETIRDLRQRLDAEADERRRLTLLLTGPEKRRWWSWRRGK